MVYSLILLVPRKPSLTLSQFKHHWETVHIPLLKSLVGHDFPLSHTRHYIERDESLPAAPANVFLGTQEDFRFDALAVLTFADKAHWERFTGKLEEEGNKRRHAEDARKFVDVEGGEVGLRGVTVGETRATGRDGGMVGWRFVGSV